MIDLRQIIQAADDLEPLPASAARLAGLVGGRAAGADDIAEVITFDQALTLKILRTANSAASASETRISDVRDALARMDSAQVLAFAMSTHTRSPLALPEAGYGLSENQLWRHSVFSALAAESLPRACGTAPPPEAFTAALLHDIGKLVLNRFLTPEIVQLIREAEKEDNLTSGHTEMEIIQVHHAEVGALVAQRCLLSERIVKSIQHHHQPHAAEDELCDVVYLANLVANTLEVPGPATRPSDIRLDEEVVARLGLRPSSFEDLCVVVRERFLDVAVRYEGG